jgi:predicted ATPase
VTGRWDHIRTLFAAVLDADPERQEQVLEDLCGSDAGLRDEMRSLLAAYRRRGFVDELAERLAEPAGAAPIGVTLPARIGRYDVVEQIGQGGMAVVYKGYDSRLDRAVALKLLSPAYAMDSERRRRLVIEARAAAALDHPSIATVYEVDAMEDGRVFLAMAFYEGETLRDRIAQGPLPVAEAVRIAHQIGSGLAAAHARGITHRDLKPANVLLTRSGTVKLLDFGIAKVAGADETREGELLGTPAYMAPEQLRGGIVDARTDVWALGLVLYEMLTGTRGPLDRRRDDIPRALGRIIDRALSPLPEDRYTDGVDMTAALARWIEHKKASVTDPQHAARLPASVTSFFGREREIEAITRLLADARLLTLTGPGGTGKTRLAVEIATRLRDRYDDGAWFVSLAAVADSGLVCSEIARVLGAPEPAAVPAAAALASFLRSRRMLLVVDNFEHVAAAAPAIARLLADCADLQLLVTSRVPLKIAGEHEYPLLPLPHPAAPPGGIVDLDAYPATALFLDRARAACPDFAAAGDETRTIAELCARLDGLPLAIELAAARVKLFSPRAMLARLDRRFELLGAGGPDRPARHQNLRQALAWSYDLLTPDEQWLFRQLSVFVGGCGFDNIAALSRALGRGDTGVIDGCMALIDHSLVVREDDPDGMPRLRMLDTIREFALHSLGGAGEAQRARTAHADLFLALSELAEPHLTGPDQAAWFDRLEIEHDNLRAALSWTQADGDLDRALRLGCALWRFWVARGHLREGRDRLQRLLALPGAEERTLLRARVLNAAATVTHETSDFSGARPLVEESLAIAREHGDRPLTALVLNNLAWLLVWIGEQDTVDAVCEDALALNRERGDPRGVAIALHNLGWLLTFRGDYERARALHEESLGWRRVHGDQRGIAFAITDLAWVDVKRGALDRAARLLDEARMILEPLHDYQLLAFALSVQGMLEHAAGRSAAAFDRFEASIELWRAVGNVFGLAGALINDADAALDQGAHERAARDLDEALPLMRGTGICYDLADCLRACGRLAACRGNHAGARAFYEEAVELYGRLGNPRAIRECQEAVQRIS